MPALCWALAAQQGWSCLGRLDRPSEQRPGATRAWSGQEQWPQWVWVGVRLGVASPAGERVARPVCLDQGSGRAVLCGTPRTRKQPGEGEWTHWGPSLTSCLQGACGSQGSSTWCAGRKIGPALLLCGGMGKPLRGTASPCLAAPATLRFLRL